MKIIENYCIQPRPYADSEGFLKIELEVGDNRETIIEEYHKPRRGPLDYACLYKKELSTDKILVFKRIEPFLD